MFTFISCLKDYQKFIEWKYTNDIDTGKNFRVTLNIYT